jgi:glutaredoxin 2
MTQSELEEMVKKQGTEIKKIKSRLSKLEKLVKQNAAIDDDRYKDKPVNIGEFWRN